MTSGGFSYPAFNYHSNLIINTHVYGLENLFNPPNTVHLREDDENKDENKEDMILPL